MSQRERGVTISRIEYSVEWPPGSVASHLLEGDEPVLVDAGMPGPERRESLVDGLADHGYTMADVEHLVVTHPHIDHIGLVPDIVEAAEPTLYAPAGVRERFARDADDLAATVRANARAAGLTGEELEASVELAVESLERNRDLLSPDRVDVWMEPGTLQFGESVTAEAVHTPGHQADHLGLRTWLDDVEVLLSGDMVIEPFRPVVMHTGLDDGVEGAFSAFSGALDRLSELDPDRVYPGHGPTHERFDEVVERDRASLDRTLELTVEAVSGGVETAIELARRRANDRSLAYVVIEVVGALRHLEREGRLDATVVDGVRHYHVP